jgi:spore coat protein SA
MKIGIITPADLPVPAVLGGAIETLIDNFIKENEKSGLNDIIVYSKYNAEAVAVSERYHKTTFRWIKENWLYRFITFVFRILRKAGVARTPYDVWIVYKYAKKDKPDILLIEGNPTYVKFLKNRMDPECKIYFHIHALLSESKYGYLAEAINFSDFVLVVSDYIKSDLLHRYRVHQEKIYVVYNCAGESFFNNVLSENHRLTLRDKFGFESTDFVLIFAGRLVQDKGLLELIKACKEIRNTIKFKLLILGSFGSDFGKLNNKKEAFQLMIENEIRGLEHFFVFCGFIQNEQIAKYYAMADLAVVPSLCEEAAGLVAVEAMVTGIPVIYSDRGGIKEYVTDKCGIMVNMDSDNSVDQLVKAILKFHDDSEFRKRASHASYDRSQLYNPQSYYNTLNCIFNFVNHTAEKTE